MELKIFQLMKNDVLPKNKHFLTKVSNSYKFFIFKVNYLDRNSKRTRLNFIKFSNFSRLVQSAARFL